MSGVAQLAKVLAYIVVVGNVKRYEGQPNSCLNYPSSRVSGEFLFCLQLRMTH